MADQFVKIEGLEEVLRKVSPDLYEKPLARFFNRAGIAVTNEQKGFAAVDTGRMRASLGEGATESIWEKIRGGGLRIGTNVNERGTSYPRILDESPRYHYAAGTRSGQQTMGWFSRAPERAQGNIDKAVSTLATDIGKEWQR